MQYLEIVAQVPNRKFAEIYTILCDFESYSKNSKAVRSVNIKTSSDGEAVSVWEVDFRGGALYWIEKDTFDAEAGTITFEQLEGDVEIFTGQWKVQDHEDDCLVSFAANFDMGIPSLSQIIDPIAASALRENITSIIRGLFGEEVKFLPAWVDAAEMVTAEQG